MKKPENHLNTIEQGLLRLQDTLNDSEMINEVFRAAHSIKGGAAMLGLSSIQHTAHRLEDCFKVLKDNPVQVDQKLESLFLNVSDTLKELLKNLGGPFGLSEEAANKLMSQTEPVFQGLNQHLERLVGGNPIPESIPAQAKLPQPVTLDENAFRNQVLQVLREMLQLFKQPNSEATRQNLLNCCQKLIQLGESFHLPNWCGLCQATSTAIASPENSYLNLAKILITEIKQAQELVLQGKEAQITISPQLQAFLPIVEIELLEIAAKTEELPVAIETTSSLAATPVEQLQDNISSLFAVANEEKTEKLPEIVVNTITPHNFAVNTLFEPEESAHNHADTHGSAVGIAELNTLADLFEGETPDLDTSWQQVETLDTNKIHHLEMGELASEDVDNDVLADFLFDDHVEDTQPQATTSNVEDLTRLFGDHNFLSESQNQLIDPQPTEVTKIDALDLDITAVDILEEFTVGASPSPHNLELTASQLEILAELDVTPNDILEEFTVTAEEIQTSNISTNEVTTDLLLLSLDNEELLPTDKHQQPQLSTQTQIDLDDLFLENTKNLPDKLPQSQPENLSLDDIFTESVENISHLEKSEIGDLFDSPPALEVSSLEDDLNNFWSPADPIEQPLFNPESEQNVARDLDSILFASAADHDIFTDTPDISPSITNFDLEDFDMTFFQPDQSLELTFDSQVEENLFDDLAQISSASTPLISDTLVSLPEKDSFSQQLEPLSFTSEFSNQDAATTDSGSRFADLDIDLFDTNNDSSDESLQAITGETIARESTHIQPFTTNLFGDIPDTSELDITLDTAEMEVATTESTHIQPFTIDLFGDISDTSELDINLDTAEMEVAATESTYIQPFTIDLFGDIPDTSELDITLDTAEVEVAATESTYIQPFTTDLFGDIPDTSELDINLDTAEVELAARESTHIQPFTTDLFGDIPDTSELDITLDTAEVELAARESTHIQPFTTDLFGDIPDTSELDITLATVKTSEMELVRPEELVANIDSQLPSFGELTDDLMPEIEHNLTEDLVNDLGLIEPSASISIIREEISIPVTSEVTIENESLLLDDFAELEALLEEEPATIANSNSIGEDDFAALEALLSTQSDETLVIPEQMPLETPTIVAASAKLVASSAMKDEFKELEDLLADTDTKLYQNPTRAVTVNKNARTRLPKFEETMKVPVKQLDDMSNLVGELVVNRNTLEENHDRLRQSLDNLLIQVQQLSDVGARMQELYERSLLEASLLASRRSRDFALPSAEIHADGFSALEMDRFTPFHTLSQEMIEFIVRARESASDIDFVTEETERVARQFRQVTTQLQEGLTRARMVPFAQTIDRLRLGVRNNAIKCGKQVELMIEGGDTLIDKMILDHLVDPLTHMLNNAIAHGIETPEVRELAGKQPTGIITIRAFHQGNQTVISVGDDGAGIDPEKVKAKALRIGLINPEQARTISRLEVYDLLFQPGFSMKDQADEIAGRGVGMDVVRSEISEIRGIVNTDSGIGKGTLFTIRLPLTLSICKALCCVSDKARIAFPMDGVEDTLNIPLKNIQQSADGQSFIYWRDTVLPFRPLKELLTFNRQISRGSVYGGSRDDDMVSVVVVRSANTLIALQIDQVLNEQEIVIKQFEGQHLNPSE